MADITGSTGVIVSWCLTVLVVIAFGAYAIFSSVRSRKDGLADCDFFLTARNSQSLARIAWSFTAGYLGAWTLTLPASNGAETGIVGVLSYGIWCGLPIWMIALLGVKFQEKLPSVLGFTDYARLRFGSAVQTYVALIMIFSMGVALTAEYNSISGIFDTMLGGKSGLVSVIVIGLVTMMYTAYGGLYISILTDQYQAIFGFLLVVILIVYFSATFRPILPELPSNLITTYNGNQSLITMPIALFCATIFSESPWQRALAAENPRTLRMGALLATCGVSFVCITFGILGWLAQWGGLVDEGETYSIIFILVSKSGSPVWLSILLLLLATTMCESSVDTLQSALVNSVSSMFFRNKSILWARVAVIVINIPAMILSQYEIDILTLFMLGNKIASISGFPLILGIFPWSFGYITGPSILFSSFFSYISVVFYGFIAMNSVSEAAVKFAYLDPYDIGSFLVPPIFSLIGLGIWIGGAQILTCFGMTECLVPGFQCDGRFDSASKFLEYEPEAIDDTKDAIKV